MLNYSKLSRHPSHFLSFTGLKLEEFNKLYNQIGADYEEFEKGRLQRGDRQRAIGGGRDFDLDLKDRMLMAMVYWRLYITYALCGYLFDLDGSNVYRDIKMLGPLIKSHLPIPEVVSQMGKGDNQKKVRSIKELLKIYPDLVAVIDATEQSVQRPKDKAEQKKFYSGRKKRHTIKSQLVTNTVGIITHTDAGIEGSIHDYSVFKSSDIMEKISEWVAKLADSGYQGISKDYPGHNCIIPKKASKKHSLQEADKRYNKILSGIRVIVEHVISRMKKFRILSSTYRNAKHRYKEIFNIVAGIVNFRTMNRLAIQN